MRKKFNTIFGSCVTFVTQFWLFASDICTVKAEIIKKYRGSLIGMAIGAIAGWAYYYFIGCSSGSCAIASNWQIAVPYGAVMGLLMAGIVKKEEVKKA